VGTEKSQISECISQLCSGNLINYFKCISLCGTTTTTTTTTATTTTTTTSSFN